MSARKHGHRILRIDTVESDDSEPRIIQQNIEKEEKRKSPKGKKLILYTLFIITIIIFAGAGIYYYIIPRVEVELVTVYHEGTGGASSGGIINVNTQISNKGTRIIENINISLEVIDPETNEVMVSFDAFFNKINQGGIEEPKLDFMGDHFKAYSIKVKLDFSASGNYYSKEYFYEVEENDAMNLFFREEISEWGF